MVVKIQPFLIYRRILKLEEKLHVDAQKLQVLSKYLHSIPPITRGTNIKLEITRRKPYFNYPEIREDQNFLFSEVIY